MPDKGKVALVASIILVWGFSPNIAKASDPEPSWGKMGTRVAICACADAEIAVITNDLVRIYYQILGPNRDILSKSSTDNGVTWTQDPGVRISSAAFPSLLKMKDGSWRMYIQTNIGAVSGIGYSTSNDGLVWSAVSKIVLTTGGDAYPIDTVGGHSVLQLSDGTFLMTYIGTAGQAGSLFWATSVDGDTWVKKGMIIDARDEIAKYRVGIDGSELVQWDANLVKLYFRGFKGIEVLNYTDGKFETESKVVIANSQDATGMAIVPGDPTLAYYGGRWHMFHGMGPKQNSSAPDEGIYEASYSAAVVSNTTIAPQANPTSSPTPSTSATPLPNPVSSSQPKVTPSSQAKKTTIKCVKGKTVKNISGINPKCPSGYKIKK